MASHKIEPHKITRPIQLLAGLMVGLLILVGAFLTAAVNIESPPWLPVILVVSAIAFVPLFVFLFFWLLTRFREQLQDDPYYADWRKRQDEMFQDFQPENVTGGGYEVAPGSPAALGDREDLEKWRISRYEHNEGLFLIHTWRPSNTQGQVADIIIQLHQHHHGPLDHGDVEKVEYNLGPKFFPGPVTKTNKDEKFRLEVSAYGPMLCVARVFVRGREEPIKLERYINFEKLD